jgi:hypothetical protein
MKKCAGKCGQSKDISEYYKNRGSWDGLDARCKECAKQHQKDLHAKDHEKFLNDARIGHIRRTYKMSPEAYLEKARKQNFLCAVCGESETHRTSLRGVDHLSVDHDHSCCSGHRSCGKCVRDLMCRRCGAILGRAKDDPELLKKLLDYILRWRGTSNGGNPGDAWADHGTNPA